MCEYVYMYKMKCRNLSIVLSFLGYKLQKETP